MRGWVGKPCLFLSNPFTAFLNNFEDKRRIISAIFSSLFDNHHQHFCIAIQTSRFVFWKLPPNKQILRMSNCGLEMMRGDKGKGVWKTERRYRSLFFLPPFAFSLLLGNLTDGRSTAHHSLRLTRISQPWTHLSHRWSKPTGTFWKIKKREYCAREGGRMRNRRRLEEGVDTTKAKSYVVLRAFGIIKKVTRVYASR